MDDGELENCIEDAGHHEKFEIQAELKAEQAKRGE
jgi:hypothetical protein